MVTERNHNNNAETWLFLDTKAFLFTQLTASVWNFSVPQQVSVFLYRVQVSFLVFFIPQLSLLRNSVLQGNIRPLLSDLSIFFYWMPSRQLYWPWKMHSSTLLTEKTLLLFSKMFLHWGRMTNLIGMCVLISVTCGSPRCSGCGWRRPRWKGCHPGSDGRPHR